MDYKDQLVLTGELSDTGNPLSVNVEHSYRLGIELQGKLTPCRWFEWTANATWSRNRIKDFTEYIYDDNGLNPIAVPLGSTPIAFSPSWIANNDFTFRVKGFEGSLTTHYTARQYLTNTAERELSLDPYCTTDLSLTYSFGKIKGLKGLTVGATVYNIFNAKYFSNGYGSAGYYLDGAGQPVVYRYAGFAAQATAHVMGRVTLSF